MDPLLYVKDVERRLTCVHSKYTRLKWYFLILVCFALGVAVAGVVHVSLNARLKAEIRTRPVSGFVIRKDRSAVYFITDDKQVMFFTGCPGIQDYTFRYGERVVVYGDHDYTCLKWLAPENPAHHDQTFSKR